MRNTTVSILLVEDDEIDAEAIERAFEEHEICNPILRARDGIEALEILRGANRDPLPRPFIVLLDLNMPRMNGIEFLAEVRNDATLTDSVVCVLTTSEADRDKAAAYSHHIAGYLAKSNLGEDFIHLVEFMESMFQAVEFPPSKCELRPLIPGAKR